MRNFLLFYVNGVRHEIRGAMAFLPLSTFLREELGLTGTKIVCTEGDCGSCTVLLGKPDQTTLRYQPICSCIQYLAQLDGTHIITIEGLHYDGQLNPIQQSMVEQHGAQCGFCTPGFVTALCSIFDEQPCATTTDVTRGLVGNLCRCTGYGSILAAAQQVDPARLRKLTSLFPTAAIAADLSAALQESVIIDAPGQQLFKPTTVKAAAEYLAENPQALIIAGGTDLGVQANKGRREYRQLLSTRSLTELVGCRQENEALIVGANTSLSEFEQALQRCLPEFATLMNWFGSPLIKNAGTLGGNIGNGSPIGDTLPALYVLNAQIELTGPSLSRSVNINDYYTGYKQSVRQTQELITRVQIPLPTARDKFKLYKISRRKDLDISTMTAALWMQVQNQTITAVRIAYGGVGPNVIRLSNTEAALIGQPWSERTFQLAGPIAQAEIHPLSDVRGESRYRQQLAANLLLKFYHELTPAPSNGHVNGKLGSTHD